MPLNNNDDAIVPAAADQATQLRNLRSQLTALQEREAATLHKLEEAQEQDAQSCGSKCLSWLRNNRKDIKTAVAESIQELAGAVDDTSKLVAAAAIISGDNGTAAVAGKVGQIADLFDGDTPLASTRQIRGKP